MMTYCQKSQWRALPKCLEITGRFQREAQVLPFGKGRAESLEFGRKCEYDVIIK